MEDTGSFLNDVLDEIDVSDPAAVSSSVTSILSVMNTAPSPSSDDSSVNLHNSPFIIIIINLFGDREKLKIIKCNTI